MRKKYSILLLNILIIMLAVFDSGCWDAKDINDKLIVTTVALDYKDGEIIGYAETANIQAGSGGNAGQTSEKKFNVTKAHAKTIIELRDNWEREFNKPTYLSGVNVILLTEDFANKYLAEYLYRFRADEAYRKKGAIIFTKQNLEDLFKVAQEKDISLGMTLDEIVHTLDKEGKSISRTIERLIENISSPYSGILMQSAGIENNEIAILGYSVVNGAKITGFIPAEKTKSLIFLKSDKPKFDYDIPYKDLKLTAKVTCKKPKIKPSYKDGKISFDVKMDFKAELLYGDKKTPYNLTDEDMKKIGDILSGMLKKELENTINEAQNKYKCDYLQFDDTFRIKYPEEFEKMDWQNEFSNISVNVDTNVKMTNTFVIDYNTGKPK